MVPRFNIVFFQLVKGGTVQGVLLLNLGTPDAPTVPAVRRYLREFLSDPRVIDIPTIARWLLVNTIIVPFRARQSAHAYQQIWTQDGSPLLLHGLALQRALAYKLGNNYRVALGMRYGSPSIQSAITDLQQQHCQEIILLPLFPQYSSAATGSALEAAIKLLSKQTNIPQFTVLQNFYQHPAFIDAYAQIIQSHLNKTKTDMLIFSYHGLPERQIYRSGCQQLSRCQQQTQCPQLDLANANCYRGQCYATSRALAQHLNLNTNQYKVAFQSRLGHTPWIKPYTDELLNSLAQQGIKNIAIVCPAFIADCLETLEEIGIRAREQWQALGGESLQLIPCLNSHPAWVEGLTKIITHSKTIKEEESLLC